MGHKRWKQGLAWSWLLLLSLLLAACGSAPTQPHRGTPQAGAGRGMRTRSAPVARLNLRLVQALSPNRGMRQRFLVIHYTAADLQTSLQIFANPAREVSAHYLIPDHPVNGTFVIYQLVPDAEAAWHAGLSYWQKHNLLNESSIGIELVNRGFPASQEQLPWMQRSWAPFAPAQIQALGLLAQNLVRRYHITPVRVVGHMDIAPGRKSDPGPRFPWQQLYREFNVGAWYDDSTVAYYRRYAPWNGDMLVLQQKLSRYGYQVPLSGQLDRETVDAISAFQMHFYPTHYDGSPDVETVARLDALLEKYNGQSRPRPGYRASGY